MLSPIASEERWERNGKCSPGRSRRSVLLPLRPTGYAPETLLPRNTQRLNFQLMAYFYSATLAWFYSALDRFGGLDFSRHLRRAVVADRI